MGAAAGACTGQTRWLTRARSGLRQMAATPGPGSPVATTCLNDAMNEHEAKV